MKKLQFLIDSLLNILSTSLPLLVLQLFSLPILANKIGEEYGLIITIISIITVISFPAGNVINNIRLLRNDKYEKEGLTGDFNYILFGSSLLSSLLIIVLSFLFIENLNKYNIFLMVLIVVFSVVKEYFLVSYRINLNFKGILINNFLLSIGYVIGTIIFYKIGYWEFIYITGLIVSLVYIVNTTSLIRESFGKTRIFKETFKDILILYGSSILKSFLTYADKIILLPLLGNKSVAIYYAASILSKIILMIFTPINSVILSYITKMDKINKKIFIKLFISTLFIGVVSYFITILVSPYFLNFFYPQWASDSLNLVYITSATGILAVISSLFNPFNIRYNSLKWQIYISLTNLVIYLGLAIVLTSYLGLLGFTIAGLVVGIIILVFQILLFILSKNSFKN